MPDYRIVYIIAAQLSFAIGVSLFVGAKVHDVVPHDWNATAWSDFSEHMTTQFEISGIEHRILFLLTMHMMHMYCYMPMLHVTKILYGYWLGVWVGWALCVLWELLLFVVFLNVLRRDVRSPVQKYITAVRKKNRIFLQLSIICVSSLPLQTKTLVVKFSDVTNWEYLRSNLGPTIVLTLKNVACGALLATAPTPKSIAIISFIVAFTLVLPTLSTLLVSSKTIFVLLANEGVIKTPVHKQENSRNTGSVYTPLHEEKTNIDDVEVPDMRILHALLHVRPECVPLVQDALRTQDNDGHTPLLFLLELCHSKRLTTCVKILDFAHKFMIDTDECVLQIPNHNGDTPLHLAAAMLNRDAIVKAMEVGWLVDKQQNVLCQQNGTGATPLHVALTYPCTPQDSLQENEVRALIDVQQNVLVAIDASGDTPLHHAMRTGFMDMGILELLVGTTEDVLATTGAKGDIPLHLALAMGVSDVSVILLLLGSTKQALYLVENAMGHTPLSAALYHGASLVVLQTLFLSLPTRLHKQHALVHVDYNGQTPLLIALHKGAHACVLRLLMQLKDPFVDILLLTDEHSNTPLHIAIRENCAITDWSVFVDYGKHVLTTSNTDGNTPLHIAVLHVPSGATERYLREIQLLVELDRQVLRFTNKQGFTPYYALLHSPAIPGHAPKLSDLENAILSVLV